MSLDLVPPQLEWIAQLRPSKRESKRQAGGNWPRVASIQTTLKNAGKEVDGSNLSPYMALTDAVLTVSTGSDAEVANSDGQMGPGEDRDL